MYQLVESVRIENRQLHLIEFHNQRLNSAMHRLFGATEKIRLEEIITIPPDLTDDRYKCRVTFSPETINVNILPYVQREIKTLKVVHDDKIEYSFKSENRQQLDAVFEKRNGCDDIIIIKNRFVTDSRAANILFFDGSDWVTPDTPLLEGVQREYLLSQKLIKMKRIKEGDIKSFQKIKLINAMIDFDRANEISVSTGIIS